MNRIFFKFIILAIVLVSSSLNVSATCLKEGDKVRFTGIVSEELYYGPPGWGEDKQRDEKLYEWILHLNEPLTCVENADTDKLDWNQNIQLIMRDDDDYETKKSLLGQEVSVEGEILLAETGYHMTAVLLDNARFVTDKK